MSIRYRGLIPIIDQWNPDAFGRDDNTGLPVMHGDMVKQMEYIGNGLAWTGFMTHYKNADQPNPQLMPPRLMVDPVPVSNPRYLKMQQLVAAPKEFVVTDHTESTATLTWDFVQGAEAYKLIWFSEWQPPITPTFPYISGEENTFTVTNLAPFNTYYFQIASVGDVSSAQASDFSSSAYSDSISATLN